MKLFSLTTDQRSSLGLVVRGLLVGWSAFFLVDSLIHLDYFGILGWLLVTGLLLRGFLQARHDRRLGHLHRAACRLIRAFADQSPAPVLVECEEERLVITYAPHLDLVTVTRGFADEIERARHPEEEHWNTAVDVFLVPRAGEGDAVVFGTGELHIHPLQLESGEQCTMEFAASLEADGLATSEQVLRLVDQLLSCTVPSTAWVNMEDDVWAHYKVAPTDPEA